MWSRAGGYAVMCVRAITRDNPPTYPLLAARVCYCECELQRRGAPGASACHTVGGAHVQAVCKATLVSRRTDEAAQPAVPGASPAGE